MPNATVQPLHRLPPMSQSEMEAKADEIMRRPEWRHLVAQWLTEESDLDSTG